MDPQLSAVTYQTIVEHAPDGVLVADHTGSIVFVNDQLCELFGYDAAELIGERVELLVPASRRGVHLSHREVYQDQPTRRPMGGGLELEGCRKDGSEFPVEISLSPCDPDDQQLTIAVVRDVTARKRTELALRRSEERHRLLAEHSEDVIFRYRVGDAHGFEYVSPAAVRVLGHAPEEFYAHPELWREIVHEDDVESVAAMLSPQSESGVETTRVLVDHELRWMETSVRPIRRGQEGVVAVEGIMRDVTERREAEEENRQLLEDVQRQIERERIARDLHDDVIQSIYATGLALRSWMGDDEASADQMIERTTVELNALIADLRSFMRELTEGGPGTEMTPAFLRARLDEMVSGIQRPVWTVDVDLPAAIGPEIGRAVQLMSKELISNVQRHANAEYAELKLRRTDTSLALSVKDDGDGFDQATVGEGSYGLRSLRDRSASLGGQLTVESKPGEGSQIVVTIPLGESDLASAADPIVAEPGPRRS